MVGIFASSVGFFNIGIIKLFCNISGMMANDIIIEYTSAKTSGSSGEAAYIRCSEVIPSQPGDVPFFRFFMFFNTSSLAILH